MILNAILHVQRKKNYEEEVYSLNMIAKQTFKSNQGEAK